jgi:hypothetical protein
MASIFAAAGLAEAAWATAACVMSLALAVVGVVIVFAFALRSQGVAVFAAVLLLLATLVFQPWQCFSPFEEAAYADPDVRSAAETFRVVGVAWVVSCVAAIACLLFVFLFPKKDPRANTTPGGAEGAPSGQP